MRVNFVGRANRPAMREASTFAFNFYQNNPVLCYIFVNKFLIVVPENGAEMVTNAIGCLFFKKNNRKLENGLGLTILRAYAGFYLGRRMSDFQQNSLTLFKSDDFKKSIHLEKQP